MAVEIKVPDMGESVIEATVARWMKQEGDAVSAGEPVVELETDKINLEVGAQQAGVLEKITHPAGDTVKVGDVLATVSAGGASGSTEAPAPTGAPASTDAPAPTETPAPKGTGVQPDAPAPENAAALNPPLPRPTSVPPP